MWFLDYSQSKSLSLNSKSIESSGKSHFLLWVCPVVPECWTTTWLLMKLRTVFFTLSQIYSNICPNNLKTYIHKKCALFSLLHQHGIIPITIYSLISVHSGIVCNSLLTVWGTPHHSICLRNVVLVHKVFVPIKLTNMLIWHSPPELLNTQFISSICTISV